MSPFLSLNLLLTIGFAIFYYRGGEFDCGHGLLWAAMSIVISILIWRWLNWGPLSMVLGQIVLFIGIGVFRVMRKE